MKNVIPFPKAKTQWFSIKNIANKSADVYIYDVVGDSWAGNDAVTVVKQINALEVDKINLRINSPGGSVFDGVAIYNALINHKAVVTTYIDGLAASIASVIALAGNEIIMAENAMFMIHDPMSGLMGRASEMRREADLLDQIKETLINTYESRTGLDRENIATAMTDETWFTAKEALEAKYITSVSKASLIAACADTTTLSALGYTKSPDHLPQEPCKAHAIRRRLTLFGKFHNIQ